MQADCETFIGNVVKADGRREPFAYDKLYNSLVKSGLDETMRGAVVEDLRPKLYDGIPTRQIRTCVLNILNKRAPAKVRAFRKEGELYVRTSKSRIERFDKTAIIDSLVREASMEPGEAKRIARKAEAKLRALDVDYISSPLIREIVCMELLEDGKEDVRLRYTRLGMPVADMTRLIEQGSKDNANLHHNPETVHKFAGDQILREYMFVHCMPRHITDAHLRGDIHLHDADYYAVRPNCLQHDLSWFFRNGLRVDGTGDHTSAAAPPKHAMVAGLHAAKIMASSQTNMAGGQSLDNFNIFMAPFMAGLTPEEIKQVAQMFVYEMNMQYVARGGQVVFSSINLDLTIPRFLADQPAVGPGGKNAGTYADYYEENLKFTDALLDVFLKGDSRGKPHLFPNTIVKVRPEAFKRPEQRDLLLKTHVLFAKYGTPYILNMCPDWQTDSVNAMGCRTRLSGDWAKKMGYANERESTMRCGNIHYNTVNLPRCALEAGGDEVKALALLDERMELIRQSLVVKHDIITNRLYQNHVLPFLAQNGVDELGRKNMYYRFEDLTHTLGFVGVNEYVRHITDRDMHEDHDAAEIGVRVVRQMREWADRMTAETGWRWTLTQTPAETTAGRFASLDMQEYGDRAIVNGDRKSGAVYYTNSSHVRVDSPAPIYERALLEGRFHPLCNGGHIAHFFLGEESPDPEGLMSLTQKLCRTNVGLFDYTRDLTVCKRCATTSGGMKDKCPKCGADGVELEYYSRITGYCQRVGTGTDNTGGWNKYKIRELADRKRHTVC